MNTDSVKRLPRINWQEIGTLVALILFGGFVAFRNENFLTASNINDILRNASILLIMSLGMMQVIITRGIDLSVGSMIALCGMTVTRIMVVVPQIPPIIAILMGMILGTFLGSISGVLVAYGNIPPIIATMGMMNVDRGVCYIVSGGEWVSAYEMTDGFKNIALGEFLGINYLIWISIIVFLIGSFFLKQTDIGRRIYAVGSNPDSAAVSGINVSKTKLMVYSLNGMLAGLSGILWVSRYASAQGNSAMGYEMNCVASCVLGGVSVSGGSGRPFGLLLGVLFFGLLYNSLSMIYVSPYAEKAIEGVIILLAVVINSLILRRQKLQSQRKGELQ